jgi:hypothetical protein
MFTVTSDLWEKQCNHPNTSHSAYVATSIESNGVKIDGFLYPNFM